MISCADEFSMTARIKTHEISGSFMLLVLSFGYVYGSDSLILKLRIVEISNLLAQTYDSFFS